MATPLFLPLPIYVSTLEAPSFLTIQELCRRAGVECRASGRWIDRKIAVTRAKQLAIKAEPGDWGAVELSIPRASAEGAARIALALLAYSLHDLVAKESIKGAAWARIPTPRGRPRTGKAKTSRERQRDFRRRASSAT